MTQSKLGSLVEALTNIVIGLGVGFVSNIVVLPLFGYHVSLTDGFLISVVFTVISLVRSYVVRRVFNKYNFFSKGG